MPTDESHGQLQMSVEITAPDDSQAARKVTKDLASNRRVLRCNSSASAEKVSANDVRNEC